MAHERRASPARARRSQSRRAIRSRTSHRMSVSLSRTTPSSAASRVTRRASRFQVPSPLKRSLTVSIAQPTSPSSLPNAGSRDSVCSGARFIDRSSITIIAHAGGGIYLALALKLATAGRAGTARQADSSYHRAQAARAPLGDAAHLRQSFEQGYETAQPLANGSRRVAGKAEADTVLAVVTAGHSRWIKGLSGQQRHPHAAGCRGQHAGTPPRRQAAPQVEATARARGDLETGRGWAQPRQHGRAPLGIGC